MKAISSVYENSVENDLLCSDFGQWLLKKYDLVDKIYSSSTSQIFMLIDKESREYFVLKVMQNIRVIADIDAIQSLVHPNIVKIHRVVHTDKFTYTIKEFIPGVTLEQYVKTNGPLPENEAIRLTNELCNILQFLHSQPTTVIYRDLKPANVMLTDNYKIKLIDLDSIRLYKDAASKDTIFIGTEGFAAPEQFGFSQTDERTDIYTLGTTLFYLLSGQNPVLDKFKLRSIKAVRTDISDRLSNVIERATMFHPEDRYQNVSEFRAALNSTVEGTADGQSKMSNTLNKLLTEEKYKFYTIVVLALTSMGILLSAAQSSFNPSGSPKTDELSFGSNAGLRITSGEPITFILTPNSNQPTNEKVLSIIYPKGSTDWQYSYDNEEWYSYHGALVITENSTIYAKAAYPDMSSISNNYRVENIEPRMPMFYIQHSFDPELEYDSEEKIFTMTFSQPIGKLQYSFDEINWIDYDGPMLFTKNCYLYTRAVLSNGDIISGGVEISNIIPKNKAHSIDHRIAPELETSSDKKVVTIIYPKGSLINEYSFDKATWFMYTEPITVIENCYISSRALMSDGQLITGSVKIENINP